MSGMQALFMNYGPQLLLCDSADFDGANDYMTRGAGLDGAADSKSGIISCWARIDGGNASTLIILDANIGASIPFRLRRLSTNKFVLTGENAAAADILELSTPTSYTAAATWLHILISWNLAVAGASNLYINDVSDKSEDIFTDDTIDYTHADWGIGATPSTGGGKWDGCLAELYFAPGQYLDFSNVYQRRKFISSSGKPVYLGTDGSAPTGTAPIVYQRVAVGAAVATFATNLGTGGNFSITGTLTDGSTTPSD